MTLVDVGEALAERPRVEATGHGGGGPSSKEVIVGYGFWIFMLSDIVMFSAFFAAHAVLQKATAGGPRGAELFHTNDVVIETSFLLLSSFTCGLATVAADARRMLSTQLSLFVTGLFGAGFLYYELHEFQSLIDEGAGPQRSAFLSSFFALVGCHGAHVTVGLLWLGTMMAQIFVKGFRANIERRMLCFNLFWHMLDIVWIAIFTLVYLVGEIA